MSIAEDRVEQERIARQAAIKEALAEASQGSAADEPNKAEPSRVAYDQSPDGTIRWRKLKPWERIEKNRVVQFRPLTSAEFEAETERAFLKQQFAADQAHAENVKAAEREQAKEQKGNDERREQEARTGKRPYEPGRYISIEQARARGLLGVSPNNNGQPEWWSPNNPHGIMGGGR